jgi:hypothetical protein
MGLAMADPTRDTAAGMLKALRSADLSNQPLAVGLADALEVLMDRDCVDYYDLKAIIEHLRANNHA